GPTHHGLFDIAYMRSFPNMQLLSPGDTADVAEMIQYAANQNSPVAIRYPKCIAATVSRQQEPKSGAVIECGKAETIITGKDGAIAVYGGLLETAMKAAECLKENADGNQTGPLELTVINARFAKPLDCETILAPLFSGKPLITVEEGVIAAGFGSAVLEAAVERGLDTRKIKLIGVPDRYIQHAERAELLNEVGLDVDGIVAAVRQMHKHPVCDH
ncbi:MAG: transketolase C-terminal domain-containing protein, partial [Thermoguttaceae bacterium]